MNQRVIIYTRANVASTGTKTDLLRDLRRTVEDRGDTVLGTFADDDRLTGRGKYAGWKSLLAMLDQVDQLVVANAGDLPGRNVADLLKLLGVFRDHGVGLCLHREGIDTSGTGFVLLNLIESYHAAKQSQAIKEGQSRARAAGKRIGRPPIPPGILSHIRASVAEGFGIRPTARKYRVSPATVVNASRTLVEDEAKAA